MASIEEILKELESQTKTSKEELMKKISEKQKELSGLVSKEGAAHLVARELGVNLLDDNKRQLEIGNIVLGMRNVNVIGKIFKISPLIEFKRKDGNKGKVVNLFIADKTGFVRVPLWNDQAKLVEEENISLGDTIQIIGAMSKENIYGDKELSLGRYATINPVEDSIGLSVDDLSKRFLSFQIQKTDIKKLVPGIFEIQGTIVQIFKGNFVFNTCSVCGASVKEIDGQIVCEEHGSVDTVPALVISAVADDGTGNIRVVFFRELAEKLSGLSADQLNDMEVERRLEMVENALLGKQIVLQGRVKKNKIFDRLELIANDFKTLNVLEESKRLAGTIEGRLNG